jgi:hypothetical protein
MKNPLIFIAVILLVSVACKKEEIYTPNLKGSIIGSAFLYDEFGNPLNDNSGISISITGYRNYYGMTDFYGRFEIKDVPTGTYIVTLEKEGYGLIKKYGIKHLGGTPTSLVSSSYQVRKAFYLIPKSTIKFKEIRVSNDIIRATMVVPENSNLSFTYVRLYHSFTPGVEMNNSKFVQLAPGTFFKKDEITIKWFNTYGFVPGTLIYCRAYIQVTPKIYDFEPTFDLEYMSYEDPENHQLIIPSLGDASSEFSFVVPDL